MKVSALRSLPKPPSLPRAAIPLRLFRPLSLVGGYDRGKRMEVVLRTTVVRPVTATEVDAETPVKKESGRQKKEWKKRIKRRKTKEDGWQKKEWRRVREEV